MTVQHFLSELGGVPLVARELGLPYTTVVSWRQRNKVPQWRLDALAALAIRKGIQVPADFAAMAA